MHTSIDMPISTDEDGSNPTPTYGPCIYRVPENIRKINKEAYTPQLISIGPLHYGKEELADMEKQKAKYVARFKEKKGEEVWDMLSNFVKEKEQDIRICYANTIELESSKFQEIILNDAIFIIELFSTFCEIGSNFFLEKTTATKKDLLSDLGLLENQIPYFVILGLYQLAFPNSNDTDLKELCFDCLKDHLFTSQPEGNAVVEHFTDMRRTSLLQREPKRIKNGKIENLPCAVKLHELEVEFRGIRGSLLDIKIEKQKGQIPCFTVLELQVPQLNIFDETESILRNIMALEQLHYPSDTQVCDYVELMNCLIDTENDVELLVGEEIILNNMGDNALVANMFNNLCKQIVVGDSCYYHVCEELKAHYNDRYNWTTATLKRFYFNNRRRSMITLVAVILIVLTVLETISALIEVNWFRPSKN